MLGRIPTICAIVLFLSFGVAQTPGAEILSSKHDSPQAIPFLLHHDTYLKTLPSLPEFARVAREVWGFDGVEVSVQTLLDQAGGLSNLVSFLEKTNLELQNGHIDNGSDCQFVIHLAINLPRQAATADEMRAALPEILQRLPIRSCSITLPVTKGQAIELNDIESWRKIVNESRPGVTLLVENPPLWTGAGTKSFVESVHKVSGNVGLLLRSDAVNYRLDLAMQDVHLAQAKTEASPWAIRFRCTTSEVSTSDHAEFEREVFRRTIADQVMTDTSGPTPQFVSIQSSAPLQWNPEPKKDSGGQIGIGSKTMRDAIVSIRKELHK